jgi:hypothetical protein
MEDHPLFGAFRREICEFLEAHPGFVCSACVATALNLPPRRVAITTLGLMRVEGFVTDPDNVCSRCGARGRVIQYRSRERE